MTRSKIAAVLASTLLLGVGAPAHGQVEIDVVSITGEFAHGGGGGQFHRFDRPTLNSTGGIAFRAWMYPGFHGVTESNNSGIWRKLAQTNVHKIARAGDYTSPFIPYGPQPEVNEARYGTLGDPQIGPDGRISFLSALALPSEDSYIGAHNNEIIFTMKELTSGMLDVAQEKGTKAPMLRYDYAAETGVSRQTILDWDGKRTWFDKLRPPKVMPDGTIVFAASLQMNLRDGKQGIWYYQKPQGDDPSLIYPSFGIVAGRDDTADLPRNIPGASIPLGTQFKEFHYPLRTGPLPDSDPDFTYTYFHATLDSPDDDPQIGDRHGIWSYGLSSETGASDFQEVAISGGHAAFLDSQYQTPIWDELGVFDGNHSGSITFRATLTNSGRTLRGEGVFLNRFEIALSGESAPGFPAGTVYQSFGDPVISPDDWVAFSATLEGTDGNDFASPKGSALFRVNCENRDGSIQLIARSGDAAPGAGGRKFGAFGSPLIADGGTIAFAAQLEPSDEAPASHGIWIFRQSGGLNLVSMEGASIDLPGGGSRQIRNVEASGLNDNGQISLRIRFQDKTEAIAIANTEPPPPITFGDWASENLPDGVDRSPGGDPDGDGRPNLLEFATGSDPLVADPGSPTESELISESGWDSGSGAPPMNLLVTYFEQANPGTLEYEIQSSTDLHSWEKANTVEISRVLQPDGFYEVMVSLGRGSRFVRLAVSN